MRKRLPLRYQKGPLFLREAVAPPNTMTRVSFQNFMTELFTH